MKKFLLPLLFASGYLFAEDAAPSRQGGYVQMFIILAVAVLFFYFLILRPEKKRRKNMETIRNSMKKGDRVTAMGIIGTIDQVKDNTVILKMCDNSSKIEVLKMAISEVQASAEVVKEG